MFMYNIYAIVILILFDIRRFSINSLHQFHIAAPPSQDPLPRDVVYKINRTEPRTDPCGTPSGRCCGHDSVPDIYCFGVCLKSVI